MALVEKGLAPEAVLSALTLVPAQLLGVSDRIGTIAPGKIANLVVTDGDLFKKETKIRFTIIQGRRIEPTPLKAETAPRPKPLPEDGVAYADIDHDDACIHVGEDDRR
jgi:adenine deaminase